MHSKKKKQEHEHHEHNCSCGHDHGHSHGHKHMHNMPDLKLPPEMLDMDVDDLIEKIYESDDPDEILSLTEIVLAREPDNAEALLLRADLIEDSEERIVLLERALQSVDETIEICEGLDNLEEIDDDDDPFNDITPEEIDNLDLDVDLDEYDESDGDDVFQSVRLAIMQRMAYTLFDLGEYDRALEFATECLKYEDVFEDNRSREIYYRLLIELEQWQRILTESMEDDNHELSWAYARLVAAFMLTPKNQDYTTAARMFWEALLMSPNVPFYILKYKEPVDDSDEEVSDFYFACLYSDILSFSRELLNWFTRGTILFGLLSGRFKDLEEREQDFLYDVLDTLGGRPEFEKMSSLITTSDDESIIETLAAHRCLAKR